MLLRDSIELQASPEDVFDFFEGMDEVRFRGWHPDHRLFRWTRGRGLVVGNRFYFEEVIAGKLLRKQVVFTGIEAGRKIEFVPTFWLMRLFLPRLSFRVEPLGEGRQRFVAEIVLRIGPIAARLNKPMLDALRDHMRVEGWNLKRFVESRAARATSPPG